MIRLWLACQTQWRVGFAGATGLDYVAVFQVAGALGIQMDEKALSKVQMLEGMTLERWHAEREKKVRAGRSRAGR